MKFLTAAAFVSLSVCCSLQGPALARQSGVREMTLGAFRMRYDRGLPADDVRKVAQVLERAAAAIRREYGLEAPGRIDVRVYSSAGRFRSEVRLSPWNDAAWANGRIAIVAASPVNDGRQLSDAAARSMMAAMIDRVRDCPPWLREAFAVYAGNSLEDFGDPADQHVLTFEDLGEVFSRAKTERRLREAYAEIAATAYFFVSHYGERKFKALIPEFQRGAPLDRALAAAFGEGRGEIERSWREVLRAKR